MKSIYVRVIYFFQFYIIYKEIKSLLTFSLETFAVKLLDI